MKLHLVSQNRQIHRLCQEAFGELLGRGWTLHLASGSTPECGADLYVWDIEPGMGSVTAIESHEKWRHFFLVDRSTVQQFGDSLPFQEANILLKPVTKAALTAFVADACKRCSEQAPTADPCVEVLRADRDDILQCLMQTNLKLQEYDHDRTNFLARAIHDFRAPLTAITGYCGLLLGEDMGNLTAEQREVLERMYHSAKKLSRMASAMFQLSISPRAEATLDLQRGDIRACIEQALHEILPAAEEKRLAITADTAQPPEPLFFERMKLEQVLVNLLDNACKFAPRAGTIEIKGYPYFWDRRLAGTSGLGTVADRRGREENNPNSYRIDIRDTGPGIPPTHLTKVFEEHTSYAGGVDRSGGGLGLAICRMIVNQHKGRIWAESKGGAVFSFVLPFHRPETVQNVGVVRRNPRKFRHANPTFKRQAC